MFPPSYHVDTPSYFSKQLRETNFLVFLGWFYYSSILFCSIEWANKPVMWLKCNFWVETRKTKIGKRTKKMLPTIGFDRTSRPLARSLWIDLIIIITAIGWPFIDDCVCSNQSTPPKHNFHFRMFHWVPSALSESRRFTFQSNTKMKHTEQKQK